MSHDDEKSGLDDRIMVDTSRRPVKLSSRSGSNARGWLGRLLVARSSWIYACFG